jgi:hypothetical protein
LIVKRYEELFWYLGSVINKNEGIEENVSHKNGVGRTEGH